LNQHSQHAGTAVAEPADASAAPPIPAPDTPHFPAKLVATLALLAAVAPLAIDMYLPAFPEMAVEFGTSASAVQLTLTTFLIGLALGQLVFGPLSDRFGRRPLLLVGTLVCAVFSAASALAPTVELLAASRFLQGFAGAAGIVLGRAVISDRAHGPAAAKLFGLLVVVNAVAPVVGPAGRRHGRHQRRLARRVLGAGRVVAADVRVCPGAGAGNPSEGTPLHRWCGRDAG